MTVGLFPLLRAVPRESCPRLQLVLLLIDHFKCLTFGGSFDRDSECESSAGHRHFPLPQYWQLCENAQSLLYDFFLSAHKYACIAKNEEAHATHVLGAHQGQQLKCVTCNMITESDNLFKVTFPLSSRRYLFFIRVAFQR